MADPPVIGMIVPKDSKAFEFKVLELDSGLMNCRVVVAIFLELAAVAGFTEFPATASRTTETVVRMVVVAEITGLQLDLFESS
jgi:hypothetical protein